MTSKFGWAAPAGGSLVFHITEGDRKTEWTLRKNTSREKLIKMFSEMLEELGMYDIEGFGAAKQPRFMAETVRTVDAEELAELQRAWEDKSGISIQATTEEGSMEALRARAAQVSAGAKWWPEDEDESIAFLPDYDAGEIS